MAQNSAIGIYSTLSEAEAAVRSLGSGFPIALLGGAEAGVVGPRTCVLGWLFNLGLSSETVFKYEEAIKAGKFLVIAHGSTDTVKKAHAILAKSRTEQLDLDAPATP